MFLRIAYQDGYSDQSCFDAHGFTGHDHSYKFTDGIGYACC